MKGALNHTREIHGARRQFCLGLLLVSSQSTALAATYRKLQSSIADKSMKELQDSPWTPPFSPSPHMLLHGDDLLNDGGSAGKWISYSADSKIRHQAVCPVVGW